MGACTSMATVQQQVQTKVERKAKKEEDRKNKYKMRDDPVLEDLVRNVSTHNVKNKKNKSKKDKKNTSQEAPPQQPQQAVATPNTVPPPYSPHLSSYGSLSRLGSGPYSISPAASNEFLELVTVIPKDDTVTTTTTTIKEGKKVGEEEEEEEEDEEVPVSHDGDAEVFKKVMAAYDAVRKKEEADVQPNNGSNSRNSIPTTGHLVQPRFAEVENVSSQNTSNHNNNDVAEKGFAFYYVQEPIQQFQPPQPPPQTITAPNASRNSSMQMEDATLNIPHIAEEDEHNDDVMYIQPSSLTRRLLRQRSVSFV